MGFFSPIKKAAGFFARPLGVQSLKNNVTRSGRNIFNAGSYLSGLVSKVKSGKVDIPDKSFRPAGGMSEQERLRYNFSALAEIGVSIVMMAFFFLLSLYFGGIWLFAVIPIILVFIVRCALVTINLMVANGHRPKILDTLKGGKE